jgi:hypothetical protein
MSSQIDPIVGERISSHLLLVERAARTASFSEPGDAHLRSSHVHFGAALVSISASRDKVIVLEHLSSRAIAALLAAVQSLHIRNNR